MSPADRVIPDVNTTASVNRVMQRYRPTLGGQVDVLLAALKRETLIVLDGKV